MRWFRRIPARPDDEVFGNGIELKVSSIVQSEGSQEGLRSMNRVFPNEQQAPAYRTPCPASSPFERQASGTIAYRLAWAAQCGQAGALIFSTPALQ
jgi:hypothetical protein